jgi:flagellar hook-length control protein FliK
MKDQGDRNLLSALSINVETQPRDRPSIEVLPTMKAQEQATKEPLSASQSVFASVIVDNNEREQDFFEADAQGAGEGAFFDSGENRASESAARDNQPSFFNNQFTSIRQTQPSADGEKPSVVTPSTPVEEDHSATVTSSASGKAQVVRLELPAHDSGPLSVRISMTDQMVHTQFTTDRNDLGALLFARHDQLQHNLAKSGLELGQFQVHIDQQGKQEALPDRQSRRNGSELEQQPASQDHRQPAQEQGRNNLRPSRVLSLFA